MKKFIRKIISFLIALTVIVAIGLSTSISAFAASNVTVWFYNSAGWSGVSAYVYNGKPTATPMGSWPGKPATQEGNSNWWYISVPDDVPFNIIFNNNGGGAQSGGVYIKDTKNIYTTTAADKMFADKTSAQNSIGSTTNTPAPQNVKTRVYFYNSSGWSLVDAYCYGTPTANLLGQWPGKPAASAGGGWYYIDVTAAMPFHVMFNNGGNGTDPSTKEDTYFTNTKDVYTTIKGTAFSSQAAAVASLPKASTTPAVSSTTGNGSSTQTSTSITAGSTSTANTQTTNTDAGSTTSDNSTASSTTSDTAATGDNSNASSVSKDVAVSGNQSTTVASGTGNQSTQAVASQSISKGLSDSAIITISVTSAAVLISGILAFVIVYLHNKKLKNN